MAKIFLSYRRSDTQAIAGRVYDRFAEQFGAAEVFMDVDTIPPGVDFREQITEWISTSDVLVVIVGQGWLRTDDEGRSALHDSGDFVRIELQAALERNIPVVPLLVDDAVMPAATQLPDELEAFAYRNAISVSSGRDFNEQMQRLFHDLRGLLGESAPVESATQDTGIKELHRRVPPRRTLPGSFFFMFLMFVISAGVGLMIGLYSGEDYRLSPKQFIDTEALAKKLKSDRPEVASLVRGMDGSARGIVEEYLQGTEPDLDRVEFFVRRNLNALILDDGFLLGDFNESWPESIQLLHKEFGDSESPDMINRKVLELIFPNELQRWASGQAFEGFLARVQSSRKYSREGLIFDAFFLFSIFLLFPYSAYCYALGSLELVFKDSEKVQRFLDDYVTQMGFTVREKTGDEIVYKASLLTMFLYTVMTLRVKIDGQRMLITGPLPLIRRVEKRLSEEIS